MHQRHGRYESADSGTSCDARPENKEARKKGKKRKRPADAGLACMRTAQRPMPLVGPAMPGPLGEPEEPLPMVPTPPEVGLALGMPGPVTLLPAVPVLPELPDACAVPQLMPALPVWVEADALALPPLAEAPVGGQSALPPVDAAPARLVPDAAEPLPLDVDMPVEPLPASPPLRVFGSTELPEPMVRELMPDVLLVGVCACARPAAARSAARLIEVRIFMLAPS